MQTRNLLTVVPENRALPFRIEPRLWECRHAPDRPSAPLPRLDERSGRIELLRAPWRGWETRRLWACGDYELLTGRFPPWIEAALAQPDAGKWVVPPLGAGEVGGVILRQGSVQRMIAREEIEPFDPVEDPEIGLALTRSPAEDEGGVEEPVTSRAEPPPVLPPGTRPPRVHLLEPGPILRGRWLDDEFHPYPLTRAIWEEDSGRVALAESLISGAGWPATFDPIGCPRARLYGTVHSDFAVELFHTPSGEWWRVERTGAPAPSLRGMVEGDCVLTRYSEDRQIPAKYRRRVPGLDDDLTSPPKPYEAPFQPSLLSGESEDAAAGETRSAGASADDWPPDDGWHFRGPDEAAFEGVRFTVKGQSHQVLIALTESPDRILSEEEVLRAAADDVNVPPEWRNLQSTLHRGLTIPLRQAFGLPKETKPLSFGGRGRHRALTLREDLLRRSDPGAAG